MMPTQDPQRRFRDILDNIERIEGYLEYLERPDHSSAFSFMVMDAIERCLQRVSEAARKLGPIAEDLAPEIQWRDVRGIGNHLRHEYENIDATLIMATARHDLPRLKHACLRALARLDEG